MTPRASLLLAVTLLLLPGARCGSGDRAGVERVEPDGVHVVAGVLTAEGVECPALRTASGTLYTLSGPLGSFVTGDTVCVRGRPAEMSICQQGVTLAVEWIGRDCTGAPKATKAPPGAVSPR